MTNFKQATNIKRTPAKLSRIGHAESVIDTLRGQRLTREELFKQCDISQDRLSKLLAELREYGILTVVDKDKRNGVWEYKVGKPSQIEMLKADMMTSTQAAD